MTGRYDRQWVERFFDEYGEKVWDRLVKGPANEGAAAFWRGLGWRSYEEVGVKAMMFMIE